MVWSYSISRLVFLIFLFMTLSSASFSTTEEAKSKTAVGSLYEKVTIRSISRTRTLTLRMKALYPTSQSSAASVYNTSSTLPVVIFMGGWFIESNRYQWLGERLVNDCGVVWISTDALLRYSGYLTLTSIGGSAFDSLNPTHGVMAILDKLNDINSKGALAGRLDLNRVILGGHSWGGRAVIVADSNRGRSLANVVGAFVYAAHAEKPFFPSFVPGSMMRLKGSSPWLLMAANRDEIMQAKFPSASRTAVQAVRRTFDYSIGKDRTAYFVEFDGFNHMSGVYPEDSTVQTAAFDGKCTHDKASMMEEIYLVVSLFIRECAYGDRRAARQLNRHLFDETNAFIKNAASKGQIE